MSKATAVTVYHNPRCSKSRATLALLEQQGIAPTVVLYLQTPPSPETLRSLLTALQLTPRQLLRTGEDDYQRLNLGNPALTDEALLEAMSTHPKLIERPIVVKGKKAVLGRPPENVLSLL